MPLIKSLFIGSSSAFFGILLTIFVSRVFYFSFIPQKIEGLTTTWELTGTYPILEVENLNDNCKIVFDKNQKGVIRKSYYFEWYFNRWTGQLVLKSIHPEDQRFDGHYSISISEENGQKVLSLQSDQKAIRAIKTQAP